MQMTACDSMEEMTATVFYRYPSRSLIADYVRSGCGILFGLGVLLLADPSTGVYLVFGALTAIFGAFGLRTLRQQLLQVAVNREGIFTKGMTARALPWATLKLVKLRYFGTRRQQRQGGGIGGGGGFMQLTLKGETRSMHFESSIDGFRDIAWHAARAARENGLSLDPTTAGNLLGIGIDADEDTPRPEGGASTQP